MNNFSKDYINRKHIHVKLSDRCNLNCIHCYLGKKTGRKVMSLRKVQILLEEAFHNEIYDVTFSGGEPFLYPELKQVIKVAKDIGYKEIRIQSNGTVSKFNKSILDDIDYLCLSLDGPDRTINDQIRGNGSFDRVMVFIKEAKKHSCKIKINYVVNNINRNYLKEMALLVDKLKINELHFQALIPIGNASNKNLALSPSEWNNIKNELKNDSKFQTLDTSICYQERFVTKDKLNSIIDNGYSCSLIEELTYWVLPDGKVYHCLCLINTPFNSKTFDFKNRKFIKNKLDSNKITRSICNICNYGYCRNSNNKYIIICPVWKNYLNKPPY